MVSSSNQIAVYLEVGKHRTLASALDWPGWCRGGRDEASALEALVEYGPRYERALSAAGLPFQAPADVSCLLVVERLAGNATTDFGAPDIAPSTDAAQVDDAELRRLEALLKACWSAFDAAVLAAEGKELRKGPRGGGRDVAGITRHVLEAEASYLVRLGGKRPGRGDEDNEIDPGGVMEDRRQAVLGALGAASRGEFPLRGPRGGARWTPRYFVRRAAWHVLDHAWEIEDRSL